MFKMPKRVCPFDDDLSPQMKVHVGQKEVDNGVHKESQMKKVYDKTLNLLMKGAKELSQKLNESIDLNLTASIPTKTHVDNKPNTEQNMKQMVLNNKLQLEVKENNSKKLPIELCGCCRVINLSDTNRCYYCDKTLCSSCLDQCAKCLESFCQDCAIVVYDSKEYNVCLNCYY